MKQQRTNTCFFFLHTIPQYKSTYNKQLIKCDSQIHPAQRVVCELNFTLRRSN